MKQKNETILTKPKSIFLMISFGVIWHVKTKLIELIGENEQCKFDEFC